MALEAQQLDHDLEEAAGRHADGQHHERAVERRQYAARWIVGAVLLLVPLVAHGQTRGYQARACGFDMDDDGIVGEAADDCNVCDGVTTDPDGDGTDEDLIYISSATGVDTLSCGAPGSPCATINYAIETATASDGPGDGAEEIYCLAGTFTEGGIDPMVNGGGISGASDTVSIAATGSQERAWEKSKNPVMVIGWDTDNDGEYPPFDTDDTCVVDGSGTSIGGAFSLSPGSHLEIAHCTYRDYGADWDPMTDNSVAFMSGSTGGDIDHLSMHDLSILNHNRGQGAWSGTIVWNHFASAWFWAELRNVEVLDWGGFLMRGTAAYGAGATEEGPLRYQSITSRMAGCGNAVCDATRNKTATIKTWGYYTGVEVLDSVFDANPTGWVGGTAGSAIGPDAIACNRDYVVRNNHVIDHTVGALIAPHQSAGFCSNADARSIQGMVIDRNLYEITYSWSGALGEGAIMIEPGGESAGEQIEDLTITNNVVICSGVGAYEYFALDRSGHTISSGGTTPTVLYDHNTWACDNKIDRFSVFHFGFANNTTDATWTVKNNLVQGMVSTHDVTGTEGGVAPTYSANRYDDGLGTPAGWTQCTATFEADGFHLDASDTCAIDNASGSTVTVDYDGATRTGSFDVGADEEAGGEGEEPPPEDPVQTFSGLLLRGLTVQ